jgi:hypothetical protein|tara:strand:- start:116 stop:301 length:186 start_codon:yes stop_codon:yes gene_type:complete
MVTEDVWEEVEGEAAAVPAPAVKAASPPRRTSPRKAKAKPTPSSASGKTKQGSMMSFFGKK